MMLILRDRNFSNVLSNGTHQNVYIIGHWMEMHKWSNAIAEVVFIVISLSEVFRHFYLFWIRFRGASETFWDLEIRIHIQIWWKKTNKNCFTRSLDVFRSECECTTSSESKETHVRKWHILQGYAQCLSIQMCWTNNLLANHKEKIQE